MFIPDYKPAEDAQIEVAVLNSHGVGQFCEIERLPLVGETLRARNWMIEEDGGKGTAVVIALGRLGVKSGYIGKVGEDVWGDLGKEWMEVAGGDVRYLYRDASVSTGTGLVMRDPEGGNTIVDGDSSLEALTTEEMRAALEDLSQTAKFFVSGFAMPEKKALEGTRMAKALGMTTLLNPSPVPDEPMGPLDYVDYLVLNEVEGHLLAGFAPEDVDSRTLTEALVARHGCKNVLLTRGSEGSALLTESGEYYEQPVFDVQVVDTVGAGDSLLSAFIAALVWGWQPDRALEYATAYSCLHVTKKGTIPAYPSKPQTDAFLAAQATG